jgi:hypothetical protein
VLTHFDKRVDDLWAAARESFDVIPVRDARHLNWRFQIPESGPHTTLALIEDDRLLAYAVLRLAADRGDLVDWLWRPGAEPLLPAVLQAAIDHLRAAGAARVTTWLPHGHPAEPILRGAGFARVGAQHILFGARSRLESPPDVHAIYEDPATTLHMTMSDFDFA